MEQETIVARKVPTEVSIALLNSDLERYVQKAIEFGASDAKIIPAEWVVIDERAWLKCYIPVCGAYGRCKYCPPHTPEPEVMRKALSKFEWAVLVKHDVTPIEDFTKPPGWTKEHAKHHRKIFEVVGKLESLAYNDGYYLSMGFAAGSCLHTLCDGVDCQMLSSGVCRHRHKARPSMEAVGIDVFNLATKVGWDIYPCYVSASIPNAMSIGILFVY